MTNPSSIERVEARVLPLRGNDIDTDRVIPARFMRCVTFDGLGAYAFHDERFDAEGRPRPHPMNDARFAGAGILLVGRNFGCGSSREHAPQALAKWGVKALVGESFADIFAGNCASIGIPAVTVSSLDAEALFAAALANPATVLTIDLRTMTVTVAGPSPVRVAASMPEARRKNFLAGTWDTVGSLLANAEAVEATASRLPYCTSFA